MDHQVPEFGVGDRPGRWPSEARRAAFGPVGAGAGSVDEGLDINVHGFGVSPTSLQLAPMGTSESGEAGGGELAASPEEGIGEIGVPDCFIFLHKIIPSLYELGVMG